MPHSLETKEGLIQCRIGFAQDALQQTGFRVTSDGERLIVTSAGSADLSVGNVAISLGDRMKHLKLRTTTLQTGTKAVIVEIDPASLEKKTKPTRAQVEEAIKMQFERGYVYSMEDGSRVEPDHEDSPLRLAGLI